MKKVGPKNPFSVTDARAKPATEAQVVKLERRLKAKLPEDYRLFLLTINGGRRSSGGWEVPKHSLYIDTFYGLRRDFYDLASAVERVLANEPGTEQFLPDSIPIGYELDDNPILLKYGGKGTGSIWAWNERGGWRKVAPNFGAFIAQLHQKPELQRAATVRDILERDDVPAMRQYVESLRPGKLDEPDKSSGHSLLQQAADAGAVKVVAFLLDRGTRNIAGLSHVNAQRRASVIELLLTRGGYSPTNFDWSGAAAFGGPDLLRIYLKHAKPPSRTLLAQLLKNSKELLKSSPLKEREKVIEILEDQLASASSTAGLARKRAPPRR
jgi:hypothetical protein